MKIGIDLGHGVGQDRGAVSKYITEEEIINLVGNEVIKKLRGNGHEVVNCRPSRATSVTNSLSQRVNIANSKGCNLFISIHANCGGGHGSEIFTYNSKHFPECERVLNNLCSLGFTNRGIKNGNNLHVIRHTKMTAMLIEICFIDSIQDVQRFKNLGYERIANEIVRGIIGNVKTSNPVGCFKVKVNCNALNVRQQPNTNSKITDVVHKNEVYTIVSISNNWGKLKSGRGWTCLNYCKRV